MRSRRAVFLQLMLLVLAGAGLGELAARRFLLGIDGQAVRCLPWQAFLVDRWRNPPRRLRFVAFRARGLAPLIADGTVLVKQLIGMPGDRMRVHGGRFRINDVDYGRLDPAILARLGAHSGDDRPERVLADGEYALLGTHPAAFDSRYFGAVTATQVLGEATPLW